MLNIYAMNLYEVILIMIGGVILWMILPDLISLKGWRIGNFFFGCASVFLILKFTVLGRSFSDQHLFILFAEKGNEFYREMVMNVFLFFPLGLSFTVILGPWSILVGLIGAVVVEILQYVTGMGTAQVTDVIITVR